MISQNLIESRKQKLFNFITKSKSVHGDVYDYSNCVYVNATTPVDIICPLHGHFLQLPRKHASGQKCPRCSRKNANNYRVLTKEQFLAKALLIHGDKYQYVDLNYENGHGKISIICPVHGRFKQTIHSHLQGHGCKKCASPGKRAVVSAKYDTDWFVKKANAVHENKYDYTGVIYNKSSDKIEIICPIHGKFEQVARDHLNGFGCKLCGIEHLRDINARTKQEFVDAARLIHGDTYDYSKVRYINKDIKVTIICSKHGTFQQTPGHHLYGQGCPICQVSSGHLAVHSYIKSLGVQTINNERSLLDGLEIDIFIPEKLVGIEYNGLFWHSYNHLETKNEIYKHYNKFDIAANKGVLLLQFFEHEWLYKQEIVKSIIKNKLGLCTKISARSCKVYNIPASEANEFYTANHLQGSRNASINLCLKIGDVIYSCMSFSKHHTYQYELIRYASFLGHSVRGGASRLFKHFVREEQPRSIMSYADRRYSNGGLYRALGFSLITTTKPGYGYVKGSNFYSRQVFQKHKQHDLLDIFNPELSEPVNMFNNGYRRIWDAGNWKFLWVNYEI